MSYDTSANSSGWHACPAGSLQELGKKLRSAKRHQAIRSHATSVTIVLALFACAWNALQPARYDELRSNITCAEVQSQLPRYAEGQFADSMSSRIAAHLRTCPGCAERFREMQNNSPVDENAATYLPAASTQHAVRTASHQQGVTTAAELIDMLVVR